MSTEIDVHQCQWVSPTGQICTCNTALKYCAKHQHRYERAKLVASQCIEMMCAREKTVGLRRCRKCHFARYARPPKSDKSDTAELESQSWWPTLETYIEGRIQMGIRQALKDAHQATS